MWEPQECQYDGKSFEGHNSKNDIALKTIPVFGPADKEASWLLLRSSFFCTIRRCNAARKPQKLQ